MLSFNIECLLDCDDGIDRATEITVDEAEATAEILTDPGPTVRVTELGDSYVGLRARVWIENPRRTDFVRVRSEYVTAVKERFDGGDMSIPFLQRTRSGAVELAA